MKSLSRIQMLIRGTVIWRPVIYDRVVDALQMVDASFDRSRDGNSVVGRVSGMVQDQRAAILEPELARVGGNGVIVMLREVPRADWTHVVVSGVGDRNVFAYVPEPFKSTDYLAWRSRISPVVKEAQGVATIEDVKNMLLSYPTPEKRRMELRAISRGNARDGFDYVYIGSGEYPAGVT